MDDSLLERIRTELRNISPEDQKSYSQFNQQKVFDFVIYHKKVMPRTALRYAMEK